MSHRSSEREPDAAHVRDRHRSDRGPGLPDRPGRLRGVRSSGLLPQLPGLHDRRHPDLGGVPRLRAAQGIQAGRPQGRRLRDQPGRVAARASRSPTGPTCDARSATWSRQRARSTASTGRGCSAVDPVHTGELAAGTRLESARPRSTRNRTRRRATCPTRRSDRSPTRRSSRRAAKRPTSALEGARNILIQNVCPGRRTTHIGTAVDSVIVRGVRRRHRAPRQGHQGRPGSPPAERRVRSPVRRWTRRGPDERVPGRVGWSDSEPAGAGPESRGRAEGAPSVQAPGAVVRRP